MNRGSRRASFTVPATSGNFAPETIELRAETGALFDVVERLSVLVEALPTGAKVVVDVLRQGAGSPPASADWIVSGTEYDATGLGALLEMAGWRGVRLRAKSGGTAGTATVSAFWS